MAKGCLSLFGLRPSKKPQVVRCPPNEQALADLLEHHEVDTSSWGDGKAKPVASLLRELKEGSCSLRIDQAKKLLRWVEPVFVQITYNGKVLVERMKVFPNGSQRVHATVLAEKKWRDDATTVDAAIRGMREELSVEISKETEGLVHSPLENICFVESMDSASYPGVAAIYDTTFMRFNIQPGSMAERAFRDCGLPACKPFETVEQKVEGPLRLCWEWLEFHEALRSGVRGMVPPRDVEKKVGGKPFLDKSSYEPSDLKHCLSRAREDDSHQIQLNVVPGRLQPPPAPVSKTTDSL